MDPIEMTTNRSGESDRFLTPLTDVPGNNASADTHTIEMEPGQYMICNLWKRLLIDESFRRRFMHSLFLCLALLGMVYETSETTFIKKEGWIDGQTGPSFPDIRNIVDQSVETGAWLFTAYSLGYAIGSLLEGVLYGRVNDFLSLHLWCLIAAVTSGVLPMCTSFVLMLVVKFLGSFGCGAVEAIAYANIASMWGETGRLFMQGLHFAYAVGGILSPIVTEPYLSQKSCIAISNENHTDRGNYTSGGAIIETKKMPNTTLCQWGYGETNVQIAYLITAGLMLAISILFIAMYIQSKRSTNILQMTLDKTDTRRPGKLPISLKNILLILLCCILFINGAIMDGFTSFLMTFCIDYLKWTKEQGSFASSSFWMAGAASQLGGIFIVKLFLPETLILAFTSLQVIACTGFLVISLTTATEGVWFFVPLLGFSLSVVCASIYSWTEEAIFELTGWVSTFFVVAFAAGSLLNPLLIGYLIEEYSYITFPYVFVSQSVVGIIIVLISIVLVNVYVKPIYQEKQTVEG